MVVGILVALVGFNAPLLHAPSQTAAASSRACVNDVQMINLFGNNGTPAHAAREKPRENTVSAHPVADRTCARAADVRSREQ